MIDFFVAFAVQPDVHLSGTVIYCSDCLATEDGFESWRVRRNTSSINPLRWRQRFRRGEST